MKSKKLMGVLCEVGKAPKVVEIDNTLKALQTCVHGYIECINLNDNIVAVINEEGKLNGSLPNRRLPNDVIFDDFIVAGATRDGDFRPLTSDEINVVMNFFKDYIDVGTLSEEELRKMRTIEWDVSFF